MDAVFRFGIVDIVDLLSRFGVALGIGLMVGLERGWKTRLDAPGTRTAGIRTFALAGLLGGVIGALARHVDGVGAGIVLGLGFAAFAAVFAVFCRDENQADGQFSATSAVAGMVTFALGAYALVGDMRVAAAAGVATAILLALREGLHAWVGKITPDELRAGFTLLAMTFIALPLLPDRPVGPFGGINIREIWLVAIVLAAVSFLGYAMVRTFGATRGVLMAAAAGGLVSSTAVMVSNARQAAAGEGIPSLLAAGAMLASAVSMVRTLAIVAVLNAEVFRIAVLPVAAAAAVAAASALVLARRPGSSAEDPFASLKNPFDLKTVLGFAALIGVIEIGTRLLAHAFGAAGAVLVAALAGIGDVDAVTVSMAKLAPQSLPTGVAAIAVLVAVASNTTSKAVMGIAAGRGGFGIAVALASAAAMAAGVAAWAGTVWFGAPGAG